MVNLVAKKWAEKVEVNARVYGPYPGCEDSRYCSKDQETEGDGSLPRNSHLAQKQDQPQDDDAVYGRENQEREYYNQCSPFWMMKEPSSRIHYRILLAKPRVIASPEAARRWSDAIGLFMSGCRRQSSKPRKPCLRWWFLLQPGDSAGQVDGRCRDNVL
jgi:hypothetical protein